MSAHATAPANFIVIASKADWDARLETAKAEGKACVVDFFAQWCGPCKMIAPLFEALSHENPSIYFLKVDVDDVTAVAETCGVSAMPTFMVFKDGVKVDELVGAAQDKLKLLVAKYK
ncbi:Thioredoxin H-type [Tetrabaena socialis]|uniref:Thioredoxin H-type n=1 Tax=Tetrabaena socialis TaxID=47790 RepID=A0A2J8AHE1_9CHLO|nr:Thioredoxin H-type [Tetrabaena socialis]|eukprot:PNH11937.1 Thioredoxin H-type [Tetrabaena socialis]